MSEKKKTPFTGNRERKYKENVNDIRVDIQMLNWLMQ